MSKQEFKQKQEQQMIVEEEKKPQKRQTRNQSKKEVSDSDSIASEHFLHEEWSTDVEHILSSRFEDIMIKFEHEASVTWNCEKL